LTLRFQHFRMPDLKLSKDRQTFIGFGSFYA
jgi:hypothetical protein